MNLAEKENCTGCRACELSCPKKCIEMKQDTEGFLYPVIDDLSCIGCGKCERVCPVVNGRTKNESSLLKAYAAYNKAENVRFNSSSGGLFTLLAESVIDEGGFVCGAVMSDDCRKVRHIMIDDKTAVPLLRTSKYVQSDVGDIYVKVKKALGTGRKVLFTGTPCQVGGLLSYLGRDYENLITQDFICHGVPSPGVWHDYAEYHSKRSGSPLRNVRFRYKKLGWRKFSLRIEDRKGKVYTKSLDDDIYIRAFLKNIILRPSCHGCSFKNVERQADITLADFWSIHKTHKEIDNDRGISAVLVHSAKGAELFGKVSENIFMLGVDADEIIENNTAYTVSAAASPDRSSFFAMREKDGTVAALRFYTKKSPEEFVRCLISNAKHRIIK